MRHESLIYLALGTNLGRRRQNLRRALEALREFMAVKAISPVYETSPWGFTEQPDFLNLCISGLTSLAPRPLLEAIKGLEADLGRQPARRWGPRLIDIDLLFYDDLIYEDDHLTIPHPHLAERAFVLGPLANIAPDLIHPATGQSVTEMLAAVDTSTLRRLREPIAEPTENE